MHGNPSELYQVEEKRNEMLTSRQQKIHCLEKMVFLYYEITKCNDETKSLNNNTTVAHKYNTSLLIYTLLLCLAVFLFCWALFGSSKHFFLLCQAFSAILRHFLVCQAFFSHADLLFPLPSIFVLCWPLLSSSEHFSATLSTSLLFQAFFFYAEKCFGSSKHFPAMPSICFCAACFVYAKWFLCSAVYFSALLCTARHKRNMLGRAEKASA